MNIVIKDCERPTFCFIQFVIRRPEILVANVHTHNGLLVYQNNIFTFIVQTTANKMTLSK